mmetsp:Transcript_27161/g.68957  ORF Transcript_27161/g.68957 Transcript_27161/m.68957 type:complete len:201 (-) Transcript_27161:940-1542(-)
MGVDLRADELLRHLHRLGHGRPDELAPRPRRGECGPPAALRRAARAPRHAAHPDHPHHAAVPRALDARQRHALLHAPGVLGPGLHRLRSLLWGRGHAGGHRQGPALRGRRGGPEPVRRHAQRHVYAVPAHDLRHVEQNCPKGPGCHAVVCRPLRDPPRRLRHRARQPDDGGCRDERLHSVGRRRRGGGGAEEDRPPQVAA